ncbi:hypothetical protein GV764_17730 [Atlantibacter hermannii]|uniref:hypothetical protein n=1 Tax=Atlantibacter hermannii TaxID=565 RepID=UPI00137686F1|nr:hypothetical protein [Atlantibacter hermannii]NBD00848.1 hypothetical protein [Atlantibacter hermannii]
MKKVISVMCLSLSASCFSAELPPKKLAWIDVTDIHQNAMHITTPDGKWTLIQQSTHADENGGSDPDACVIEYQTADKKAEKTSFRCVSLEAVVGVTAFPVNSKTIIIDFQSERGGIDILFSLNKDNAISSTFIPYMSGDEDGIAYFLNANNTLTAVSAFDKFTLRPDENNEYWITGYQGTGAGLKVYGDYH